MKPRKVMLCVGVTVLGVLCLFTGCKKGEKTPNQEYEPTSSLQMTESEAAALGEKVRVKLYFTDSKGTNLCTECQLVEFTAGDRRTENMAKKICDLLAAGPADKNTYVSTLPKDVKVRSVRVDKGVATVDFNSGFIANLPEESAKLDLMCCAIANTLTELKEIHQVIITVDNKAPGKMECGFEFKATSRNMELVAAQAASAETEYTEEAFADVPLE